VQLSNLKAPQEVDWEKLSREIGPGNVRKKYAQGKCPALEKWGLTESANSPVVEIDKETETFKPHFLFCRSQNSDRNAGVLRKPHFHTCNLQPVMWSETVGLSLPVLPSVTPMPPALGLIDSSTKFLASVRPGKQSPVIDRIGPNVTAVYIQLWHQPEPAGHYITQWRSWLVGVSRHFQHINGLHRAMGVLSTSFRGTEQAGIL